MKVKKLKLLSLICLFLLTLASCIFHDKDHKENASEEVNSYYIKFLSVKVDPITISRNSESQAIVFSWNLRNFCPYKKYELKVYLSRDDVLDDGDKLLLDTIEETQEGNYTVLPGTSLYNDIISSYGGRYNVIFRAVCLDTNDTTTSTSYLILKTKWTFMVYMDGDNSLNSYVNDDALEMEQVGSSSDVNVIIQADRLYAPAYRYFVKPGSVEELQSLGEPDMGDPNTLESFLNWAIENFPADHYFLVLWNHGGGFKRLTGVLGKRTSSRIELLSGDIAIDETSSNDALTIPELREALEDITRKLGQKIDIIGMDACLMAMIEVAYDIKDTASYLIASENTEPGPGWPYDKVLEVLVSNPDIDPKDLAIQVVKKYIQSYPSSYWEATQSAIDLSKVGNLTQSLNSLTQNLLNAINQGNTTLKNAFQTTIYNSVQRFDDLGSYGITLEDSYVDLYDLLRLVKKNFPSLSQDVLNVEKVYNSTILASNNTGPPVANATGLSIWFPNSTVYSQYINKYKQLLFANNTVWDEFLGAIWN